MRVVFYAPMKAPTHPVPSGDRRVARLFLQVLGEIGANVSLASDFRSYEGKGDTARQAEIECQGLALADQLIGKYQAMSEAEQPTHWFTYHNYHKAPDWLGPKVSGALDIPYIVAEASHAPKQAGGPWDRGYLAAAKAISRADLVLAMTNLDMACLRELIGNDVRLEYFPPFLDNQPFAGLAGNRSDIRAEIAGRHDLDTVEPWLLSVAMMRPGDKLQSYRLLAHSLQSLNHKNWRAILVGDGAVRKEIAGYFHSMGQHVVLAQAQELENLMPYYGACDIYVWPAVNEAYGMAFLEAQAAGLPVVAGGERGVGDVVRDGITGLLTEPRDPAALAQALTTLIDNADRRKQLGENARDFINSERNVRTAARTLTEFMPTKLT